MLPARALLALLALALLPLAAQEASGKRALTHDDYDQWQSIRGRTFTDDGSWMAYEVAPQVGDGTLIVRATARDGARHEFPLGTRPRFTSDGRFLVFTRDVAREEKRLAEWKRLNGDRKAKAPEPHVAVLDLESGEIRELEGVRRVRISGDGTAILVYRPPEEEKEEKGDEEKSSEEAPAASGEEPGAEEKAEKPSSEAGEKKPKKAEAGEKKVAPGGEGAKAPAPEKKKAEARPEKEARKSGEKKAAPETPAAAAKEARAERPRGRRGRAGRAEGGPRRAARGRDDDKKKGPKWRKKGEPLVLLDLRSGEETRIEGVTDYGLLRDDELLWYARNSAVAPAKEAKKETKDGESAEEPTEEAATPKDGAQVEEEIARGLFVRVLGEGDERTLVSGAANFRSFSTDEEHTVLAFLSDRRDRAAEEPNFDVWTWDFDDAPARRTITAGETPGFPENHEIANRGRLGFSRDGSALTLSLSPVEPEEEERKVLPEDRVKLDIWHWKDPLLQPMQARRGRRSNDDLTAVWHADADRVVVLSGAPEESVRLITDDGSRALLSDPRPYLQEISWDGRYTDLYLVNTVSGARERLGTRLESGWRGAGRPSPSGRYVLVWSEGHWYCHDLQTMEVKNLTVGLPVSFASETWDRPEAVGSYGTAGWLEGEEAVLLNDRYDIWRISPDGEEVSCVTDGVGRAGNIRFRRVDRDREERYVPTDEPLFLTATDEDTMASGYWTDEVLGLAKPRELFMRDARVSGPSFVDEGDAVFFTMSTFETSPDVWMASDDSFGTIRRLTDLNPQQDRYRWGSAELVRWTSTEGERLKGILIKPEGFDPEKKYPMMVYFYERRSQTLHNYVAPAPGTSPNPTYYVSNGYLWFIPDIHYTVGYPGESCVDCVVSGVQSLIERGFVDRDAIGAAGHSWGGYQTAYLVTKTDIFKAVESGAPVSNMTSAYGGIRWGSGMSRAFQYEKTQSRIGATLWERPLRYIENSPLFFADRVNTPVLMLHNDEDGAVPWYQGIEYFTALRRLGKEVYMFNYNDQGHGLRRRADQMDWTMRMQQYFDHHLRGRPAPDWMRQGVPYDERMEEKLTFNEPWKPAEEPLEPPSAKPAPAEAEEAIAEEAEATATETVPAGGSR